MVSVKKKADSVRKLDKNSPWFWTIIFMLLFVLLLAMYLFRFELGISRRVGLALAEGQRAELLFRKQKAYARLREAARLAMEDERRKEAEAKAKLEEELRIQEQSLKDNEAALRAKKFANMKLGDDPVVVLVVKGLGLSASTTERALELPQEVTLGFSPYAPDVKQWVALALERGNDIILNIPMETLDFRANDPGPYALMTSSSGEDNKTRLNMLLGLVDGYVGVYSERDEIFTQNQTSVRSMISLLRSKHIPFVFGGGYDNFSLIQLATKNKYPLLVVDVVLDDDITQRAINDRLDQVEKMAIEKGAAIAMAHPYPITIEMIEQWIFKMENKGVSVVPISAMVGHLIHENVNLEDGLKNTIDASEPDSE